MEVDSSDEMPDVVPIPSSVYNSVAPPSAVSSTSSSTTSAPSGFELRYTPIVWSSLFVDGASTPSPRAGHSATAVCSHWFPSERVSVDTTEEEEPQAQAEYDAIVVFGGKGHSHENEDEVVFNDVYLLRPSRYEVAVSTKLETTGAVPPPTESHSTALLLPGSSAVSHPSLLVFGGYIDDTEPTDDLFLLNLQTLVWTKVQSQTPGPSKRHSHSSVVLNQSLIVISGGYGSDTQLADTWVLDTVTWRWHEIANFAQPRYKHTLAIVPSTVTFAEGGATLILFGGMNTSKSDEIDEAYTDMQELIVPPAWHPSQAAPLQWTYPVDGKTRGLARTSMSVAPFGHLLLALGGNTVSPEGHYRYPRTCALFNSANSLFADEFKATAYGSKVPQIANHSCCLLGVPNNDGSTLLRTHANNGQTAPSCNYKLVVFGGESPGNTLLSSCYIVTRAKRMKRTQYSAYLPLARFFNNELYSDVILRFPVSGDDASEGEKKAIPCAYAQRSILVNGASYFRGLLASGMQEASRDVLDINDCAGHVFMEVLRHFYSMPISQSVAPMDMIHLWEASDFYNIPVLKDICLKALKSALTVRDLADTYEGANCMFGELNRDLKRLCIGYVTSSPEQIRYLDSQFSIAMILEMKQSPIIDQVFTARALLFCLQYHAQDTEMLEFVAEALVLDDPAPSISRRINKELSLLTIRSLLQTVVKPTLTLHAVKLIWTFIKKLMWFVTNKTPVMPESIVPQISNDIFISEASKLKYSTKGQVDEPTVELLISTVFANLAVLQQANAEHIAKSCIFSLDGNANTGCMAIINLLGRLVLDLQHPEYLSFAASLVRYLQRHMNLRDSNYNDTLRYKFEHSLCSATTQAMQAISDSMAVPSSLTQQEVTVDTQIIPLFKSLVHLSAISPSNIIVSVIVTILEAVHFYRWSMPLRQVADEFVCMLAGTYGAEIGNLFDSTLGPLSASISACAQELGAGLPSTQEHGSSNAKIRGPWACPSCTFFEIDGTRKYCSLCNARRPRSRTAASAMISTHTPSSTFAASASEKENETVESLLSSSPTVTLPPQWEHCCNELVFSIRTFANLYAAARHASNAKMLRQVMLHVLSVLKCAPTVELAEACASAVFADSDESLSATVGSHMRGTGAGEAIMQVMQKFPHASLVQSACVCLLSDAGMPKSAERLLLSAIGTLKVNYRRKIVYTSIYKLLRDYGVDSHGVYSFIIKFQENKSHDVQLAADIARALVVFYTDDGDFSMHYEPSPARAVNDLLVRYLDAPSVILPCLDAFIALDVQWRSQSGVNLIVFNTAMPTVAQLLRNETFQRDPQVMSAVASLLSSVLYANEDNLEALQAEGTFLGQLETVRNTLLSNNEPAAAQRIQSVIDKLTSFK
eukprot:TRINITY_DN3128_c0_g1_i2.p1 TRINITY_DN3128_c0_g1~~TRINITY_DN3128_c0_g1_i2.p1  ORF type:complete len:1382 (-),score=175.30 TRINITY_DN3128_c0_g1_i2:48-4193(-)